MGRYGRQHNNYADKILELHEMAHEVTVTTRFLASSNKRRYEKILNDLENVLQVKTQITIRIWRQLIRL